MTICITPKYKTLSYIVFFTVAIRKFVCVLCKLAAINVREFWIQVCVDLITIDYIAQQKQLIWQFALVSHLLCFVFVLALMYVTVYHTSTHLVRISSLLGVPLTAIELQNILFL